MSTTEAAYNEASERDILQLFSQRLNAVLDERGYSRVPHQRYLQLKEEGLGSTSGVRKWCIGEAIPSPETLARLSRRLGASIDYLLGLAHDLEGTQRELGPVVEIPVYSLNTSTDGEDGPLAGCFKRIRNLLTEDWEKDFQAGTKVCLLECWDNLRTPAANKGDLLYVDLTAARLVDNQVYLLRTPTTVWIRRVRSLLDGRIDLAMEFADRKESIVIGGANLHFNTTGAINIPAPESGVTVIGQVSGRIEKYTARLPGLA